MSWGFWQLFGTRRGILTAFRNRTGRWVDLVPEEDIMATARDGHPPPSSRPGDDQIHGLRSDPEDMHAWILEVVGILEELGVKDTVLERLDPLTRDRLLSGKAMRPDQGDLFRAFDDFLHEQGEGLEFHPQVGIMQSRAT